MSDIKDGGPAFPTDSDNYGPKYSGAGMTLRDYFAAKALATTVGYSTEDLSAWSPANFATHAYAIADAMLRAREAS